MEQIVKLYFIMINALAFILMFIDKQNAVKKRRRIKEQIFFVLTVLGGFLGIALAGFMFDHKSSKRSFQLKILLALLLFILIVYFIDQRFVTAYF